MAARSDLQSSSSNYGLFRLPQCNTMQNSTKTLKNLFVSSPNSDIILENDTVRIRRPSSDTTRNTTLLRLDSTGNELNTQMKWKYENSGKSGPSSFVESSFAAMCGCRNTQLSALTTDVKKDCMVTCNNYFTRDSDIASLSSLGQFSPIKSTILHDYNRCLEESKLVLPKYNTHAVESLAHKNLVSSNRNESINSDGIQIDGILSGLAEDLTIDTVGTQKIDMIIDARECNNKILNQEVESMEVVLNLEMGLGKEQGFQEGRDSNVSMQVDDQKVYEMDSGNFSDSADAWEDVNDPDTNFVNLNSKICKSEEGRHTVKVSLVENIGGAKKKGRDYMAENQSNNRNRETSESDKEVCIDAPRKHSRVVPCLLRAASQRYMRGVCFMTRQSSIELDKNESVLIKALKHCPRKQDLLELYKTRRRNETDKKRRSVERARCKVHAESGDSSDEGCCESEDHSDIITSERVNLTAENSKLRQHSQTTPVLCRSQFYCPLSLSDSSSDDDTSPEDDAVSDDWDTAFSGSSTSVSSFAPIATCFMSNFFGNSCSLLWQKQTVTAESRQPSAKPVKTSKGDMERSCDIDDADKIAAEQSRKRMLLINETWTKIYSSSIADQTKTTLSFSNAGTALCPGQCSVVRVCKKVHFCSEGDKYMPILNEISWADEYASARVGPWVQMGLDRNRFQRRIAEVEAVVSKVLTPEHRSKVLLRL